MDELIEQVILQLARVNGWSETEALAQMEQALQWADRAAQGDVNAQAQLDALFTQAGIAPPSPGAAPTGFDPTTYAPLAGRTLEAASLEDGWLAETEPGLPQYNPITKNNEPSEVSLRLNPLTQKLERWGYDEESNWRRLSTESVPAAALPQETRAQLAARLGREPTEAEWSREVLGFGPTAGAAPPAQVRLLNQALQSRAISQVEYDGALRSLALGETDPTGITQYQAASLAARQAELAQRQAEFGQTFGQQQREFDLTFEQRQAEFGANIELDRIETQLRRDQAAIAAARTGNPLEYFALLRGEVPTVGTGETYQGFPRLVSPALDPTRVGVLPGERPAPFVPSPAPVTAPVPTPALAPVAAAPSVTPAPVSAPVPALPLSDGITGSAPTSFLDLMGPRDPVDLALSALSTAGRTAGTLTALAPEPSLAPAAPVLRAPTAAASVGSAGGIAPVRGLSPPVAPRFMQDIRAGRALQPVGPPAGARFPGVMQQAAMTPAEIAAFTEEKEFAGISALDIPFFLEQTRRGVGTGVRFGGFGGRAV